MSTWDVVRQAAVVGREDFRGFWSWRSWLSAWMLRIATSAAMWVLLGRMLGAPAQAMFLLVGQAVVAGPTAVGMVIPASTWDRWEGTYPLVVVSPTSLLPVMIGRTAIWIAHGIGTSVATFLLLGLAFGMQLPLSAAPALLGLVTVICVSSYCFMLALGALINRVGALRNVAQNAAMPVLMAVCGVSVPVSFWPPWVQALAACLPITHGLAAVRRVLQPEAATPWLAEVGLELGVGAAWLVVAALTMDWLADAGRVDGSIEKG
ncbi:MAG: ABC transporter permease [Polyangiales bacterium]